LQADITVNGRTYRWMDRPLVVVCVDGCQYEYITAAVAAGVLAAGGLSAIAHDDPSPARFDGSAGRVHLH